jgi:plastocyanin
MSSARANARRLITVVSAVAVVGLAALPSTASAAPPQPKAWKATAGAQTPDMGIQANAFLPRDMTVNVGDTITWTVASGEFHTVSFLSGGSPPPLVIPGGPYGIQINPDAVTPAGGSSYSGSGFFNSGLLLQSSTYRLGFGATGDFNFVCLLHSEMKGTVHVNEAGSRYPRTQLQYDQQGRAQSFGLLGLGLGLAGQGLADAFKGGGKDVTAGIGRLLPGVATVAVVEFEPKVRVVHVGDTVTFTNFDPEFPHTVTFGQEPPGDQPGAFLPSGLIDGNGHSTLSAPGQSVNSGFLGANGSFQVKFSGPGTYPYICALHDDLGMKGTIQVLP